jgi:hypothetical protein
VIAIIAVLLGLLLPAIQTVRDSARRAGVVAEISQLSNAIATYKTKFRADYIPAFGGGTPNGEFRLCSCYAAYASGTWLNWPEVVYLKSIFPQMNPFDNGLRMQTGQFVTNGVFTPSTATNTTGSPVGLDPNQTLVFFLTGGVFTNYQGFSNNKQEPFAPGVGGEQRIGPFLELASNKYDATWHLLDPYGTPYAYFSFDQYLNTYPDRPWPTPRGPVSAYKDGNGKYLQPRGFQVISAGKNQRFGPGGGFWTPNAGVYAPGGRGGDDLANFNAGPLTKQG